MYCNPTNYNAYLLSIIIDDDLFLCYCNKNVVAISVYEYRRPQVAVNPVEGNLIKALHL